MQFENTTQPHMMEWITKIIAKNRLAHAYLFVGKKGAGKKALALFFAQALFCIQREDQMPCGQCHECQRIRNRNHPDVHWVEAEVHPSKLIRFVNYKRNFHIVV